METLAESMMQQELEDHFQQAWAIYEECFPVDERRPLSSHLLIQSDSRYTFAPLLGENKTVVGVLGFWRFKKFTFIEHIGVSSACRGSGIGTSTVRELQDSAHLPLILETELPEMNIQAPKRIRWYQSLGFHSNPQEYYQPAYAMHQNPVPSRIMSYPHQLSPRDFQSVRETLYAQVYHYIPNK
jgi:ribosomal protein S18 acetylase RimI-like enzyme